VYNWTTPQTLFCLSVPSHGSSGKIEIDMVSLESADPDDAVDSGKHLRGRRFDKESGNVTIRFTDENIR